MKTISEEQIKRLMVLISLVAILDQEDIGDRFDFIYEDNKSFLPDFLKWLKEKNLNLYEEALEIRGDTEFEHLFWLDPDEDEEICYNVFKECVIFIYEHPKALKGVIKYIENYYGGMVDEEFFSFEDGWKDVEMYSKRFICSYEDAKKEFNILKSYLD